MLIRRKTHPLWCIYIYFLKIFININNFWPNSILKMQIFQASCHHCIAQRSQYHTVGLVLENRFVVQLLSCVQLFATPWVAAHQASLLFTIFWSLLKLMSIESVMLSNHFILYCPILLCFQCFPASGSFPVSLLFQPGGQNTGTSSSVSVLPKIIQGWFPLGLTDLISSQSKRLSRALSSTTIQTGY